MSFNTVAEYDERRVALHRVARAFSTNQVRNTHCGTLSPNGRRLAYISNETGAYEVNAESPSATGFRPYL